MVSWKWPVRISSKVSVRILFVQVHTYFFWSWMFGFSSGWVGLHKSAQIIVRSLRLLALYSLDNYPSYELEICLTRKKSGHIIFFSPPTCRIEFTWPVFFSLWKLPFVLSVNFFPFFIFLLPDISWPTIIFLIFFFRHARKTPVGIRHQ